MKKILQFITKRQSEDNYDFLVDAFISTQERVSVLPELSPVEKVQLEQDNAISHLYHSSKIEGTNLTEKRLEKAIAAVNA